MAVYNQWHHHLSTASAFSLVKQKHPYLNGDKPPVVGPGLRTLVHFSADKVLPSFTVVTVIRSETHHTRLAQGLKYAIITTSPVDY